MNRDTPLDTPDERDARVSGPRLGLAALGSAAGALACLALGSWAADRFRAAPLWSLLVVWIALTALSASAARMSTRRRSLGLLLCSLCVFVVGLGFSTSAAGTIVAAIGLPTWSQAALIGLIGGAAVVAQCALMATALALAGAEGHRLKLKTAALFGIPRWLQIPTAAVVTVAALQYCRFHGVVVHNGLPSAALITGAAVLSWQLWSLGLSGLLTLLADARASSFLDQSIRRLCPAHGIRRPVASLVVGARWCDAPYIEVFRLWGVRDAVVMTHGVLTSCVDTERDAILNHELSHIAHSHGIKAGLLSFGGVFASALFFAMLVRTRTVVIGTATPLLAAGVMLARQFVYGQVWRSFERRADADAARISGSDALAGALTTLVGGRDSSGSPLATHDSLGVRIDRIKPRQSR